jgi:hypothetical protein
MGGEYCAGCNLRIHFLNKPMFGIGKLTDGNQICSSCYARISSKKQQIGLKFKGRYDTAQIRKFLLEMQEKPLISGDIFALMVEVSEKMEKIVYRLALETPVKDAIAKSSSASIVRDVLGRCVAYDLQTIFHYLKDGMTSARSAGSIAFALVINKVWPWPDPSLFVSNDNLSILKERMNEIVAFAEEIPFRINAKNPVTITSISDDGVKKAVGVKLQPDLSLPLLLLTAGSSSFDEYCSVLYNFATMIARADGPETEAETSRLKQLFQTIHHPDVVTSYIF